GRLIDLMRRGVADLTNIQHVVLDEADEMLSMGFQEDLDAILEGIPQAHSTMLFSATMSREIERIAGNYLHDAHTIQVGSRNEGAENVNHIYYMVHAKDKYLALKRVVDYFPRIYAIVFCRTRMETQEVADNLIRDGYNADALHGDLSQAQRDAVMKKFRERNLRLLVATDVAARGLDVDDLTHIISYSLPDDNAVYNHRSGRTGRAGKTGVSIAIIHSRERNKLRDIEKHIGKPFERCEVPKPKAIIEKQLFNLADRLEKVEVKESDIAKFLPPVLKKLSWLDSEDLLKRLLSLEFNRLLEYYQDAPELDYVPEKEKEKRKKVTYDKSRGAKEKDRRTAEAGYERVFINAGKADGFFAPSLIELINKNTHGERVELGRIDLLTNYSLFDVKAGDAKRVVRALKNADFFGKRIYAEEASPTKDYAGQTEGTELKLNRKERRRLQFSEKEQHGKRRARKNFHDERAERRTRRDAERGFKSAGKGAGKRRHGNFDKFSKKR
ncbi:MAG: DEAD/DEAH box helicase, partial [Sodaliphilus sp.]